MNNPIMTSLVALTLMSASATAGMEGEELQLHECPPAVQEVVNAHARGGLVEEVDRIAIEDRVIYIAEVELPRDVELKIYVSGAGVLVKTREEIPLRAAPDFIRDLGRKYGGTVDDVEKEVAAGKVTFHVEIDRKGMPDLDLILDAEGGVIREVEDLD